MYQVLVDFNILEDVESPPPGCTKSTDHLIFDLNTEFTRKGKWVKDVYYAPYTENSSYTGVVSRESIWITLTTSALQIVDVLTAGRNTHLISSL